MEVYLENVGICRNVEGVPIEKIYIKGLTTKMKFYQHV